MITSHKHDAICSKLLNHASLSKIRCKHSACLAIGSKIISLGINNKRTKWNNEFKNMNLMFLNLPIKLSTNRASF